MAFHKIKLTFVVLILVYLCAWGLKQHILKDKSVHGSHTRNAPRILRWAKNASHPAPNALQSPINISLSVPPFTRKPAINGRLKGRKDRPNIGKPWIVLGKLGQALYIENRLVQKNSNVSLGKLMRDYITPAILEGVRKMYEKKKAAVKLRRRRSKNARGAWRGKTTISRNPAPAMDNSEGDFRSARFWGRKHDLKCLGPTLYDHLRWGGNAGRVEKFKLMRAMWSACLADFEGQSALPFVHIIRRSSRTLKRAWALLVGMYHQDSKDNLNLNPMMYLVRIHHLNKMMTILNKMKGVLRHWRENSHHTLAPCFQCLPVWLHYFDLSLTQLHVFDFLLNTRTSQHWPASSSFSSTKHPLSKSIDESEEHMRLNPPVAALLVRMTELLNDQGRRVSGLNSSLYGLQRSLSPTTLAQNESTFLSLLQNLNTNGWDPTWVQPNASDDLTKRDSFCQTLIHSLKDAYETTKNWIHTVYELVVRGVKFLCDQLLALYDLGLEGIKKWLISQYNQFQVQLVLKITEGSDVSTDHDATVVDDVAKGLKQQLKLNESTREQLSSNESQNVKSSAVESKSDSVIRNVTASNIEPNDSLDLLVNKTKTYSTRSLPQEPIGRLNESKGMASKTHWLRSTMGQGSNESQGIGGLAAESRVASVLLNATAEDGVPNVTSNNSSISPRTVSSKPVLNKLDLPQKGGLDELKIISKFSVDKSNPSRVHFYTKMKDMIKIWIRLLIVLKYVGKHVNSNKVSTEKETLNFDSSKPAINATLTDQTWRLTGDKNNQNNQTAIFERIQRKDFKNVLKADALAKLLMFLRQRGMSNINETRNSSKTLKTSTADKQQRRINSLNDNDGLVRMWISKTRQLSRFLTWLILLPQRTLLCIRRVELANLELRMAFFRRIFLTRIDSQKSGQEDDKTERLEKAIQREAFRNQQIPRSVEKKDEKRSKFKVVWKFHIYKIEDSQKYNRTNSTTDRAQLNITSLNELKRSPQNNNYSFKERPHHFNTAKHGSPQLQRNAQNTATQVLRIDNDKHRKWFKRPFYVKQLERRRRSLRASGDDEDLKKQMKKLHRIANSHKKGRPDDFLTSEKFVKEDHQRKVPSLTSKANRPASHHFSKDDADILRSKLLNLISLVESHKNNTAFSSYGNVTKEKSLGGKLNLDNKDDYTKKWDDSNEYNSEEPADGLLSNALNGEPTEADFELLNNIEILTKKFLGKKNRNSPHAFYFDGDMKQRNKRSEDKDDDTAEELGETPESDQMKKTEPDDKLKESRQFLQKWSALRKEAQNLQTQVNSARDKYASASDELALLLKKGNTLHDKVESASGDEGVHKSMLEENWKNVNKEFDKYKSDMAAREKEILSEDKRVNGEKIDNTLLRLEDAISEQGDPNDIILGDTAVLPFNAKLDRMGPALKSMKNEALLAGQIASDEVMLESEDAEDDVFKGSEAADYSIVDFDYNPGAKFVDEEDSDIAEDAESLTGFDYEIDRHSDAQLEDVDNILSKLIARRFRSKRSPVVPVLKSLQKTSGATTNKNVFYHNHTIRNKTSTKTLSKNISTSIGVSTLRHSVNRRASPAEISQALNSVDEESGDYEEQSDFLDEIKDIEGEKIVGETNEITADNNFDLIYRYNLSNPKVRAKTNRLFDVAANKEVKSLDKNKQARMSNKKVGKFKSASDLLGYDGSEVGVDAKELNDSVRHNNDMVAIPLGSDADIENGIEEIMREKEFLAAEGEKIDEEIPSDEELKPFDEVIKENMDKFSDGNLNDFRDDTWKQKTNFENAQLRIIGADEEKQKMELAASSETQRNREKYQHNSDLVELEVINKGLVKAYGNLDQATKDIHKPPPKPSGDDLAISLNAGDSNASEQEDEINEEAHSQSKALPKKRRSVNMRLGMNIAKFHLANVPALEPNSGINATTKEPNSVANTRKIAPNSEIYAAKIAPKSLAKGVEIEPHSGSNDTTVAPNSEAKKGKKLIGIEIWSYPRVITSTRIEREANPNIGDDERDAATAEGSIDGDLDEEIDVDDSMSPGMYDDDILYEDDNAVAEEWEIEKPSRKLKKPKKVANYAVEGIEGQLLDAKSVVRQLKEEEEVAGNLLPPSSLVSSEQDLMEFGRKPEAKDMFLNILNPVGLAELSDEEVAELSGPVLSFTDTEKALDNPTALVSALEDIENEIKNTKNSVLTQTSDINRLDGADEVIQQIGAVDEMGSGVIEKKAMVEDFGALGDARRTRLTQKLLDEQEEKNSELMDGGNALGEALQDIDQYKVDKEMDQLTPFITFKDVLQKKKTKTIK